jgi:glycosyltransferase involved in cell wall biosynthesis
MPDRPSLYGHYVSDDPCRFHRILQPFRFLAPDIPHADLICSVDPGPRSYDAYVLHGLPDASTFNTIGKWKRRGGKFVWSVDDDWLTVPEWNPAKPDDRALANYYVCRDLADAILCSTVHLASTFTLDGYGHKVAVAPNLLDTRMYPPAGHPPVAPGEPVRVLWAGGGTHAEDTAEVEAGISRVLDRLGPAKVEFHFFGSAPPPAVLRDHLHRGVTWVPHVEFARYWQRLADLRPHVVLAPLAECEFNRSKSSIRVLDSWALSAAVVASPVGEYRVVRHGETGVVADTPHDWEHLLLDLIGDHALRKRVALAGRAELERDWAWQSPAAREPWRQVVAGWLGA